MGAKYYENIEDNTYYTEDGEIVCPDGNEVLFTKYVRNPDDPDVWIPIYRITQHTDEDGSTIKGLEFINWKDGRAIWFAQGNIGKEFTLSGDIEARIDLSNPGISEFNASLNNNTVSLENLKDYIIDSQLGGPGAIWTGTSTTLPDSTQYRFAIIPKTI